LKRRNNGIEKCKTIRGLLSIVLDESVEPLGARSCGFISSGDGVSSYPSLPSPEALYLCHASEAVLENSGLMEDDERKKSI